MKNHFKEDVIELTRPIFAQASLDVEKFCHSGPTVSLSVVNKAGRRSSKASFVDLRVGRGFIFETQPNPVQPTEVFT